MAKDTSLDLFRLVVESLLDTQDRIEALLSFLGTPTLFAISPVLRVCFASFLAHWKGNSMFVSIDKTLVPIALLMDKLLSCAVSSRVCCG